jgi:hypothetical protein
MEQSQGYSYDELMEKILPIANNTLLKWQARAKGVHKINQQPLVDDQAITQLIKDICSAQKTEKDPDKLSVLNDVGLYVGLIKWGREHQELRKGKEAPFSLLASSLKVLVWAKMPRLLVDNRLPHELARDILEKVSGIEEKAKKIKEQSSEWIFVNF